MPPFYRLTIGQANKREFPKDRLIRMNAKVAIQGPSKPPNVLVCLWRWLDTALELHYGLC